MNELYEKYKDSSQMVLNLQFTKLCISGDVKEVAYILASPELKVHADIHTRDNQGFVYACSNGHFPLIKYLLSSPELKEHADINAQDCQGIKELIVAGNLEILKYLLSYSEVKQHVDIHSNNDEIFRIACNRQQIDIIKYLIFDYKIPKSSQIEYYLNTKGNEMLPMVKDFFAKRELHESLQGELSSANINPPNKIKL